MKIFETNSGLGYGQYVYMIYIKNKTYLIVGHENLTNQELIDYEVGLLIERDDYEVEQSLFDIKDSPLYNTFLFNYFLENNETK
jgi:hypothetical protein